MTSTIARPDVWADSLAGVPPVIELAAGRARPDGDLGSARVPLRVDAHTWAALAALAPTHAAEHAALAAFALLASRWSGERDIVVVTLIGGRRLPVRIALGSGQRFAEVVRAVAETIGTASLRPSPVDTDYPGQLGFQSGSAEAPAGHDLAVALDGYGGGELLYAPEILDAGQAERIAEAYRGLCARVAEEPQARLWRLDVMSAAERTELVHGLNQTTMDYPTAHRMMHELFEDTVDGDPDATAVVCGTETMSYGELEVAANRLAHHLTALGVGPETPVGVLLDRSIDLLVGLLGVLKAGGCYVPLDPSYPSERLAFMVAETGARTLLTRSDLAAAAPTGDWHTVALDTDAEAIAARPAHRPITGAHPDNLAYVIYTSGSTGRPKGVMVPHRGVVHYLAWCGWAYGAEHGDGALVHSPLSFDLTVTGLFLPLAYGKTVTLVPEAEHPVIGLAGGMGSGADFTFVKLTPAHLNVLAQTLPAGAADSARWLVVGGEQLTAEHLAFWREHAPNVRVSNEYGHTETSVACVMECVPAGEVDSSPVSVGRPFWNTQIYLVDEDLNLVPPGVPGELLTGGIGVTRGYWGRPSLTADKFIPNPFGPGRLYRSGDVCRYLPDGRLEFVARIDRQVKVRGFRVELGEIEARLTEYPGVRQAVVLLRRDGSGESRLVAYLETDGEVSTRDIRTFARDRLPGYMVPASVRTVAEFPLTPNGKIDVDKLA